MEVENESSRSPYETYIFYVKQFIDTKKAVESNIINSLRDTALIYLKIKLIDKEEETAGLLSAFINISNSITLIKNRLTKQDEILIQQLSALKTIPSEKESPLSHTPKEWFGRIETDFTSIVDTQSKRKSLYMTYSKERDHLKDSLAKLILTYKEDKAKVVLNEAKASSFREKIESVQSRKLEESLKSEVDSDLFSTDDDENEMKITESQVIEIDENLAEFYLQEYSEEGVNPMPLSSHDNHYTYVVTSKRNRFVLSLHIIDSEKEEKRLGKNLTRHLMLSSSIKEFAKYHGSFTLQSTARKLRDFFGNIVSLDTSLPVSIHTTEYYAMTGEELFSNEKLEEEDKLSLLLQLLLALYEAKRQFNLEYNGVNAKYLRYIKLDQPIKEERPVKKIKPSPVISGSYRVKLLHHDHLKKSSVENNILSLENSDYTGFFTIVESFQLSTKKQTAFSKVQKSPKKQSIAFKSLFSLFTAAAAGQQQQ